MPDMILYPVGDMSSTSVSLRSFLDQQWSQHNALFMTNSDSQTALLTAIARVIPGSGSQAQQLLQALHNYHQQYHTCYQALYGLADQIDAAAKAMHISDVQQATGFEQME
jgi:hypothetical protein